VTENFQQNFLPSMPIITLLGSIFGYVSSFP
jgi:hypothetical protein